MQKWWTLPGPQRFSDRLTSDLRREKNVVLKVPEGRLRELRRSIRNQLTNDSWRWISNSIEGEEGPIRLRKAISDSSCRSLQELAEALLKDEDLNGHVVWLNVSSCQVLNKWKDFIRTYAGRCRHATAVSPLFVLAAEGRSSDDSRTLGDDVNLASRSWDNSYFNSSDARLLASSMVSPASMEPLKRDLATEITARIALWDQRLADKLSSQTLIEMVNPHEILKDYAKSRGWDNETEVSWTLGTGGEVFGEHHIHSGLCALRGNDKEIQRRVWSAEIGVIFPYLEARRQDLIEGLSYYLKDHAEVNRGNENIVVEKEEYEISDIYTQISDGNRIGEKLVDAVRRLKEIRNEIAHLETIKNKHIRLSLNEDKIKKLIKNNK